MPAATTLSRPGEHRLYSHCGDEDPDQDRCGAGGVDKTGRELRQRREVEGRSRPVYLPVYLDRCRSATDDLNVEVQ